MNLKLAANKNCLLYFTHLIDKDTAWFLQTMTRSIITRKPVALINLAAFFQSTNFLSGGNYDVVKKVNTTTIHAETIIKTTA